MGHIRKEAGGTLGQGSVLRATRLITRPFFVAMRHLAAYMGLAGAEGLCCSAANLVSSNTSNTESPSTSSSGGRGGEAMGGTGSSSPVAALNARGAVRCFAGPEAATLRFDGDTMAREKACGTDATELNLSFARATALRAPNTTPRSSGLSPALSGGAGADDFIWRQFGPVFDMATKIPKLSLLLVGALFGAALARTLAVSLGLVQCRLLPSEESYGLKPEMIGQNYRIFDIWFSQSHRAI